MDTKNTSVAGQVDAPLLKSIDGGIDISDPLNPYVSRHRCRYDCTFLEHPLLNPQTAKEVAYTIALRMTKLSRTKHNDLNLQYYKLRRFFVWLFNYLDGGKQTSFKVSVKKSLAVGEMPQRDDWQMVIDVFRSVAILSKGNPFVETKNKKTKNGILDMLRPFLKLCLTRGIFPSFYLNGIKGAKLHSGKRKSLGDLKNRYISEKDVERLVGSFLRDSVNKHDIIEEERKDCIRALASSGLDISGLSDAEIIKEITRFNTDRLAELRRCAEIQFLNGWETYQEGQRLLAACDISYGDMRGPLENLLAGLDRGEKANSSWSVRHPFRELMIGKKTSATQKLVTSSNKGTTYQTCKTYHVREALPDEIGRARLLRLIDGRYGMAVTCNKGIIEAAVKQAMTRIVHTGHMGWCRERLGTTTETLLAAQIILLIDTGLNTEVVDELIVDCVKDTDDPTIKTVCGLKRRASSKMVEAHVRTNDPAHKINAIEVIRRVEIMTDRLRKVAAAGGHPFYNVTMYEPRLAEKLFIRAASISGITSDTVALAAGLFKARVTAVRLFRERHPSVGAYDFTLASIRPTVALLDFMQGRNIETMRAKMDHAGIDVTSGYVVRTVSRMSMEQQIREFQKDLEAVMIFDIPGAAEKLGYTADEYKERLVKAERSGLGTFCDHLRKGADGREVSKKRTDCDPVDDCPGCPLMRVFPALKENLVDAFLTRGWIRENEAELKSHNPTRWEKIWLRWLAIVQGVIDKARSSHAVSRTTLKEAEDLARQFGADGFFLPLI